MRLFEIFVCYCIVSLVCADGQFWLTAELMRFEWKKECTATRYCSQPQLRLNQQNLINSESLSVNWVLGDNLVTDYARPFVTFWTRGTPSDISVFTEIIGFDPKYGFQRVCDYTGAKRIFPSSDSQSEAVTTVKRKAFGLERGKIIVELHGKCFEASLAVQKHLKQCPWCFVSPAPTRETPTQAATESLKAQVSETTFFGYLAENQSLLLLIASITVAFVACIGFVCVLCTFYRVRTTPYQRQRSKILTFLPVSIPSESLQPLNVAESNGFSKPEQNCKKYLNVRQVSDETIFESLASAEESSSQNLEIVPATV